MRYRKIEFWVITGVFIFIIFSFVQEAASILSRYDNYDMQYYGQHFLERGLRFDYLQHHTYPLLAYYLTVYLSFLIVNFYIYPKLYLKKDYTLMVLLGLLVYFGVVISFSVTDTWYKGYMQVGFGYFFFKNLVLIIVLLGGYTLYIFIKEAAKKYYMLHERSVEGIMPDVKRDVQIVGSIWIGVLLLITFSYDEDVWAFWFTMVPCAYFLYALNRYILLPEYELNSKLLWPYLVKLLSYSLLLIIPFVLVFCAIINNFEEEIFFIFWIGQLFVIGTLSWLVHRAGKKKMNQIVTLKKELGQTTADLQFLRSQINPHFLFNALNTLYGTALQENSERTAQGIQMLGDMMRFMIHENHQQKILLSREIEYMRNYIELQSLRVSTSPDISIEAKIEDVLEEKFIAPMLLIPFVENAFKHGISLKHKSWIRITLHCKDNNLYFDVYNSTHPKQEQDPEKDQSGIGLENVKQRLALLYPAKHELVIRETSEEYFVHLTLQL
ncbi:histidine kinase [Pontibacter harenae]|uniref:histidine kinase n=1 Tax=Pontibacter harenae TaxID=2894083 RepID=UPI001E50FD18|nr:histidine kinase [Pontibacter harenae]MCC9165927.1 histidine kinase [Pontibacter harenae]